MKLIHWIRPRLEIHLLWLALPLLLAGCASAPRIAWQATGQPGDLQARAIAVSPHTPGELLVGLRGKGVFRSADSGASWQPTSSGLTQPGRNVRALLYAQLDPQTVLLGSEKGVFHSADGGANWQQLWPLLDSPPAAFDGFFVVNALASVVVEGQEFFLAATDGGLFVLLRGEVCAEVGTLCWRHIPLAPDAPQNSEDASTEPVSAVLARPGETLIGTRQQGVLRSVDNGNSWQPLNDGLPPNGWVNRLARNADGQPIAAVNRSADSPAGVFLLGQDGRWQPYADGLPTDSEILSLSFDRASDTLYAGIEGIDTFRSVGRGPWQPLGLGFGLYSLARLPSGGALIAGTRGHGVWRSADGLAWQPLAVMDPSQSAFALNDLLRTDAAGLVAATTGNAVHVQDSPGVWRAGAGFAETHQNVRTLAAGRAVSPACAGEGQALYAGVVEGGVYCSGDDGHTWRQLPLDGLDENAETVMALLLRGTGPAQALWAGTRNGLYRFDAQAQNWQRLLGLDDVVLTPQPVIDALAQDRNGAVYASVASRGVYFSRDGSTWQTLTPDLNQKLIFVDELALRQPQNLLARWLHGSGRLFALNYDSLRSKQPPLDSFGGWERRISGAFGGLAIDPAHPQVVYTGAVSTTNTTTLTPTFPSLISLDNGSTWQDAGSLAHPVRVLVTDPAQPGQIYAGTTSGIYTGTVTLPVLWREVYAWAGLLAPALLLLLFVAYAYARLTRPFGVPLPQALGLLLFRRKALALALTQPSPLSSLQQLVLAQGAQQPVWTAPQMAGLLDRDGAFATDAQLAAALASLGERYELLRQDDAGNYHLRISGLAPIFATRAQAAQTLLAKDVREENRIHLDSRHFFQQAGFAVHSRQDVQLLTPLREAWAELSPDREPLLARILSAAATSAGEIDETVTLAQAEFSGGLADRWIFLIVPASPEPAAHDRIQQLLDQQEIHLVLLSHTGIAHALADGAASTLLQTALRRHRGEVSPANLTGPVLDPLDFFDRRGLLAQIGQGLGQGQALLLSGPPQIGKSSVVWQAAQRLDEHLVAYAELAPGPDWQAALLAALLRGVLADGQRKYERTEWPFPPEAIPGWTGSIADFVHALEQIGAAISLRAALPRVALVIDDLPAERLDWWRDLGAAARASRLAIGLAGVLDGAGASGGGQDRVLAVPFLREEASVEMAAGMARQAGLVLADDAGQALHRASGGHPLLLRFYFGQAQPENRRAANGAAISPADVAAGVERHVAAHSIYTRWWGRLRGAEQAAVLAVAEGNRGESDGGQGSGGEALAGAAAKGWLRVQSEETGQKFVIASGGLMAWLVWAGLAEEGDEREEWKPNAE